MGDAANHPTAVGLVRTIVNSVHERVGQFLVQSVPTVPEVLWHYAPAHVPASMLNSAELWASHHEQLNDRAEIVHLAHIAHNVYQAEIRAAPRAKPNGMIDCRNSEEAIGLVLHSALSQRTLGEFGPTYVMSYSTLDDDMQQWRSYANGGRGVAIRFRVQDLIRTLENRRAVSPFKPQLLPVVYEDTQKQALARLIVDTVVEAFRRTYTLHVTPERDDAQLPLIGAAVMGIRTSLWFYGALCKHRGFRSEHEWRLVLTLPQLEDLPLGRGGGISFKEAETPRGLRRWAVIGVRRDLISGLMVGPIGRVKPLEVAIDGILGEGAAGTLLLGKSTIPYRQSVRPRVGGS